MSQDYGRAPTPKFPPRPASSFSASPERLASMDAYRGFVMILMAAELLNLPTLAAKFPNSTIWKWIGFHTEHVAWVGCSLHDLIQPSFSFLVGVAMPFSLAARMGKGQSSTWMTLHALWRAVALILLGVFLRSVGKPQTYWTFEDTLTQIGLGYFFLYLLAQRKSWVHWAAFGGIVFGYWLAWVLYPAAGADFVSHWAYNANLGHAFDLWFLNLFPRASEFTGNKGGYLTLSFIPTLATMILGLIAGTWIKSGQTPRMKVAGLFIAGLLGLAIGTALHASNICPNVKKIWTPTWVFFSGGWCCLFLSLFYLVIDVIRFKAWAFPLIVVGMNSIAMYCMAHLFDGFLLSALKTHFSPKIFQIFGTELEPHLRGLAVFLILWLICLWMYRRKLFIKI